MSAPEIRCWCPGALRPMRSGDGLVVRVRPPLGALEPGQAVGVAELAETFGTGEIELTNRANLQIRGVSETGYPALLTALRALGLLHDDAEVEARSNIVLDPFHSGSGSMVAEIATKLAREIAAREFAGLPSKFGFVVDPGAERCLAEVSGDVRVEGAGRALMVRADGAAAGRRVGGTDDAVAVALELARWFLTSGGVDADGRGRMARHLNETPLPAGLAGDVAPTPPAALREPGAADAGTLAGAAFGTFAAEDLRRLSDRVAEIRLTPWRMLFLPGVAPGDLPRFESLILDAADPRLRVAACVGAPKCPQATVDTRTVARAFAPGLAKGLTAHVSGCAKGCAHPRPADVTLVGREGHFDLVRAGAPWDAPDARNLTPADAAAATGP